MGHAGAVIAGGKGTAADKYRALDKSGARTVKSPADLGKAMAELLAKRRAKPLRKLSGPNVLIIEPRKPQEVQAKKARRAQGRREEADREEKAKKARGAPSERRRHGDLA